MPPGPVDFRARRRHHSAPALNRSAIALARLRGGPLFWGVLALVIVGLLVVGAKLRPKPPAA
jgi:hypothetical protein